MTNTQIPNKIPDRILKSPRATQPTKGKMYGSVALSDSPRIRTDTTLKLRVVTTPHSHGDGDHGDAYGSPLGSPVAAEANNELARKRSANAFIPVVCSIFGVIIFMRLGLIVGTVGLLRTWAIIGMAFSITFLSIGSLSALASSRSHDDEKETGLYEAVLRSVGEHSGRVIGVLLFLAFGVASGYYLLGFAEITMFYLDIGAKQHPLPWNESGSWVTVAIASGMQLLLLAAFALGGRISKRLLKVVFVVVIVSIASNVLFLLVHNSATATGVSSRFLRGNLVGHDPEGLLKMFGEFFPAFCGVMAGAHLADELMTSQPKTPRRSARNLGSAHLIVGTHKALAFSCLVYFVLSLVLGACVENGSLRKQRFVVQLVVDSILGIPVIYLGITATTLMSALSNIIGAASVYDTTQRLSRPNQATTTADGRSVKAFVFAWCLSQGAILCGSVDTIIPIVASIFLFSFAVVNFACFYHEILSPTFSSSFIMYSKWSALLGFCLSVGSLFLVMSTFFVGCMIVGLVATLMYFQRAIPDLVGSIRRQDSKERRSQHQVSDPLVVSQSTASAHFSEAMLARVDQEVQGDGHRAKRIELAALYVRDALHGRFLGEEYVSEGLHKLEYKRWYHALQFARMGNMAVLLCLSFFEVPSWCFFSRSCGEPHHVLMWDLPVLSRETTFIIELLNLIILGIEGALKYQYLGKRLYFVNKWHVVQMVLILSDVVSVVLVALVPRSDDDVLPARSELKPIVLSPMIRPLLLLTMSERLRSGFMSLLRVLPRVMDGLLTLLVLIVIYATCGMILFEGTPEGRQYFPDFESAWLNMLILLTTANFPDVMLPAYERARYSSIFFISFLVIGLLLMMNLVFASIYQNYRQEVSQRAVRYAKRRQKSLEFAFQLLPGEWREEHEDQASKVISRETLEELISELMRPVVSFFNVHVAQARNAVGDNSDPSPMKRQSEINLPLFIAKIKGFAARQKSTSRRRVPVARRPSTNSIVESIVAFVRTKWFDHSIDLIILGNLVAILIEIQAKIDGRDQSYMRWERFMPLFSCVYLVEMALKMYATDFSEYFSSPKNRYDCVVTVVIFIAEVSIQVHYTEGMDWQWIRMLLLLRFLRCLRLLIALQSLSTMFSIVLQLLPAFTTLYGMLGIVMMEYAAIGVQIFGGKLVIGDARLAESSYGKSNYFTNNFNDFPSALTTLFELLLVNNWNIIMEGVQAVTSKWCRIYFISYYIIAVVMMLNLVVAFVVEAYFEEAATTTDDHGTQAAQKTRSSMTSSLSPAVDPADRSARRLHDGPMFDDDASQIHLRKRSPVVMRPRGDSVYIEEVL